jgi:two-component system, OmpR family, response regulator ResD
VPANTTTTWRVLLVDDDPLVSDSIRRMLEFDQRNVKAVSNGADALALCEQETFALVILDYLMPGMKGDVLAVTLKARHPGMPILMITADAEKLEAMAELPAGVDLIMGKPFQLAELRDAVNKALAKP